MRLFLFVSFFLTCSAISLAQNLAYSALTIPDSIKENARDIVRFEEESFTVHNAKNATYRIRRVVTILDQKSRARQLNIHYDPSRKVGKIKATIYDALGQKVKEFGKKDIKDYSSVQSFSIYEDDRIKQLEFFHNSYPYTVEYSYEISHDGTMFYPSWQIQTYYSAVEKASFEMTLPAAFDINHRTFNATVKPEISHAGGQLKYRWSVKDLPAIKPETYSPSYKEILPWVAVSPHYFETEKYKGSMKDWKSYGQFMHRLNEGRDQLSPKMAAQVKALTANAKTDTEKIAILYKYLQENTRYVSVQLGIGGWQTFDAEYVENNKYGDCKALTNFMKSMLLETGITAYPTLINSGRKNSPIPEDVPKSYFNHVILNIPSEDIWLECTSNHYPPNYIGYGNSDRDVLRITEKGGELIRTPKLTAADNNSSRQASITILPDGSAKISEKTQFKGAFYEYYRNYLLNQSEEEQKKDFYEDHSLPSFHIDEWKLEADKSEAVAQLQCQVSVKKYASSAGKRIFIPLNRLNPFQEIPKSIKKRKYPVEINLAYSEDDQYSFQLPAGFELEGYPKEPIELKTPYGTYTVNVKTEGNHLFYHRQLQIENGRFPAEKYDAIRQFYKEIAKKDGLKLVLIKKVIRP